MLAGGTIWNCNLPLSFLTWGSAYTPFSARLNFLMTKITSCLRL